MPLLALEQQLLSMRAKASSALGHRQGEDPEATREWQLVKVILDFKLTVLMLRSVLGFFFVCFSSFPSLAGSSSGSPKWTPGVSDTLWLWLHFIFLSSYAVAVLQLIYLKGGGKDFCKSRAGSVLPLTTWKNSIEDKTVHLKNMYTAFTVLLPLLV